MQAGQDVGFGIVGDSNESIHILDAFILKEVEVSGIGIDHQGLREVVGQVHATLFVDFQNLDVHVFLKTFGCDTSHTATTYNHHVVNIDLLSAAQLDDVMNGMRLSDHIHHVAHLKHLVALRDESVLTAVDGGHTELDVLILVDNLIDGLAKDFSFRL